MFPEVQAGLSRSDVTYREGRAIWHDRSTTTCGRWRTPSAPGWPKTWQASAQSSGGMTLCAGSGMSSRSSPTSPLRPASTSGSGDFTVASRTHVADLQLRADDGPVATGTGPLVTGSTLALVMSMAGRVSYLAELDGPGVPTLRSRLQATAA
jgi:hypothetical protein